MIPAIIECIKKVSNFFQFIYKENRMMDSDESDLFHIGSQTYSPSLGTTTPETALEQMRSISIQQPAQNQTESSISMEELQKKVCASQKILFKKKIWLILNWSEEREANNKQAREEIGLYWCDDTNFMCNKTKLAQFLRLQENTINKNFSHDGFVIVDDKEGRNKWQKRSHESGLFTKFTKESDIENLPKPNKQKTEETTKFDALLRDSLIQRSTEKINEIQNNLVCNEDLKKKYLQQAIDDWKKISESGTSDVESIIQLATEEYCKIKEPTQEEKECIEYNIKYFFDNSISLSQQEMKIQFHQYYTFFLHFGKLSRVFDNLLQVSHIEDDFSSFPFLDTYPAPKPTNFKIWFHPSKDNGPQYLKDNEINWAVKFSTIPNAFTCYQKDRSFRQIYFDPTLDENAYYSKDINKSFNSLNQLDDVNFLSSLFSKDASSTN